MDAAKPAGPPADRMRTELDELLAAQDPNEPEECRTARSAVLSGVAQESALGDATQCALWALREDTDRSERLLAIMADLHEQRPKWFLTITTGCESCDTHQVLAKYGVEQANGVALRLYISDDVARSAIESCQCHLGSGPLKGVCLPFFRGVGHYGVTWTTTGQLGAAFFSEPARRVLADAAQDPDFFAWKTMAAHAQTEVDAHGMPLDVAAAKRDFASFVDGSTQRAAEACERKDFRTSLYWTGYALHAVQDLASHRGRTNPEHSYNAKVGDNPDDAPMSTERAKVMTRDVLEALMDGPLRNCKEGFRNYAGDVPSFGEKRWKLELVLDFTPLSVVEYRRSFLLHQSAKAAANGKTIEVRWFGDQADHGDGLECRFHSESQRKTPCGGLMASALRL